MYLATNIETRERVAIKAMKRKYHSWDEVGSATERPSRECFLDITRRQSIDDSLVLLGAKEDKADTQVCSLQGYKTSLEEII